MSHSLLLLLLTLCSTASLVFSHPSSEWIPARATYHAADAVVEVCGSGEATAAEQSTLLFERGDELCYVLKCVEDLGKWCEHDGVSIAVNAADFKPHNACFVLPIEAFEKIGVGKGSNIPILYRRINCKEEGGAKFNV